MFWNKSNDRRRVKSGKPSSRPAMVEGLEGRQMFAATGPVPAVEPPVLTTAGFAVEMPAVVVRIANAMASLPAINAPLFTTQDVFGQWTGTFLNGRTYQEGAFGVNFNFRHPAKMNVKTQAFTGLFDLSAMVGQADCITTVTMSRSNDMRMLILNDTNTVSFNGALSENGKMINGRYTALVNGRYTVGSFVLTKVS